MNCSTPGISHNLATISNIDFCYAPEANKNGRLISAVNIRRHVLQQTQLRLCESIFLPIRVICKVSFRVLEYSSDTGSSLNYTVVQNKRTSGSSYKHCNVSRVVSSEIYGNFPRKIPEIYFNLSGNLFKNFVFFIIFNYNRIKIKNKHVSDKKTPQIFVF